MAMVRARKRVKANGNSNTVKKVEGLDVDEIEWRLLEELWGKGDRGMD